MNFLQKATKEAKGSESSLSSFPSVKFLLFFLSLFFLASCASTTHIATFKAPSLAPVEQAVTRVEQHVSGAQSAAKKLKAATDEATQQNKAWQDAYNQLT